MAITVLVGSQYGDEGKGKMVDYLAKDVDFVSRFQGGDNAGHTVINDYGIFKMHIVPCGVFTPGVINLIGTGTVVNPDSLIEELDAIEAAGVDTSLLYLSERAHLILPYHLELDAAMEENGGIGTTKRGVGQAYAFKILRKNPRAGDLRDLDELERIIDSAKVAGLAPNLNYDIPREKLETWAKRLVPMLVDPLEMVHAQIDGGKNLMFEGQLALLKDIDLGIYPYVTGSHTTAAYAAVSGGFSPKLISRIIGVVKAFTSAVGDGSFPTEMSDAESVPLRGTGENPDDEYGARTGRSRRLGWLDIPSLKFATKINGFDALALTKMDKLDELREIKVCTHYTTDSTEPVYKIFKGWLSDTSKCRTYAELPSEAKDYVEFIESELNVPIRYIGNGPARADVIDRM
ncbi:MAG: adenylosuccinate synthetase [Oscillospiraceae bacterium]|jgi:adenylosuccinate synthase|nr:adenylosuccinate synthetase [Oscillospiraceae bacterium]